jgi:hypothetical protein
MVSRSTLAVKSSWDACTYRIEGGLPRCLYSPNCRQGVFPETPIHPLGCLCVRTGAEGRLARRRHHSTRHLATRLDGYSPKEPTPPAPLLVGTGAARKFCPSIIFEANPVIEDDCVGAGNPNSAMPRTKVEGTPIDGMGTKRSLLAFLLYRCILQE